MTCHLSCPFSQNSAEYYLKDFQQINFTVIIHPYFSLCKWFLIIYIVFMHIYLFIKFRNHLNHIENIKQTLLPTSKIILYFHQHHSVVSLLLLNLNCSLLLWIHSILCFLYSYTIYFSCPHFLHKPLFYMYRLFSNA